jgi:membrane-bound serine protease (ClpP class)
MASRALRLTRIFTLLILLGCAGALALAAQSPRDDVGSGEVPGEVPGEAAPVVYRVEISGPITPTALDQLEQALERAESAQAQALLVRLDTPGGLVSSMDDMIRRILSARIPVITYVYPPGATCGSAGVYLMYASHVAAMAPGTNIGSATPVQMGGGGFGGQEEEEPARPADRIPETAGADDELNMKRKLLHHAIAQMRSLAEYHGRNVEFGERSITHAENITSTEALRIRAIDAVAESEAALLEQIHGRPVRLLAARANLNTAGARIEAIESDFRTRPARFFPAPWARSVWCSASTPCKPCRSITPVLH